MSVRIPLAKQRYATLLSAYAPTLPSENDAKDRFYRELDEVLQRIPSSDKILLLGDFNARVGKNHLIWKGVIGKHGIEKVNANGMRLLSLCAEHDLIITNTIFQQKNKHKDSRMHPRSKQCHLLDYIIVRRKDIKDMHITRAMRCADCWTDHRIIISKLRVAVHPPVRLQKAGKKRLDCARLEETEAQNSLRSSIADKMQEMDSFLSPEGSVDDNWTCLSSKLYEAAVESIGYRWRRHQDWFDENSESIKTILNTMHKAHNGVLNNRTSGRLMQHWRTLRKEVQSVLRN